MVDIWDGEEDVISKILNNNNHDVSSDDRNNHQTKSLHQEFMEIGENYQLPLIRKSSLEDVMQEFRQLNSVAEEKVNKDINCVYKEEAQHQNVLKPPPGFQPKTNSNPLHVDPKRNVKPPPGFPAKSAPDVDMKRKVKPPPGLPLKNVNANTANSASLSKSKVVRTPPGFPTTRNVDSRKKEVQPNLQHQKPSSGLVMIKHRNGNGMKDTHTEKPRQKLALTMEDFHSLSTIMDQELSSYEEKLVAAHNQKGCDSLKEQGKVEMLKILYYEQQEKTKVLEKQHEHIIIQTETNHKNEMEDMKNYYENKLNKMTAQASAAQKPDQNLKAECNKAIQRRKDEIENLNAMVSDLQNELDKQTTSKPNKKLQFEFNSALNEREEEIDRLNGVIHDMQCELERYEGGSDEIAMENEELVEKISIKDEYITSLKSQLSDQQKLQQQHEWKLSQADDNLEMVERDNEKMERKAVEIMSKMRTELLKERSLNQQLKQHIEMVDQHLQQWQENNKNNNNNNNDDITNINTNTDNTELVRDDNTELVREKLQKMASRSISRRSIDLSKDNLMKSLGWFKPANSK